MGGIPNLVGEAGAQGFAQPGVADVATNAETQLLRFSVRHPDLRIIFNVTEGLYRIVARRSAGIASIADLKGKRVATIEQTSAATSSTACWPRRVSASTTSPRCRWSRSPA